MRFLVERDGLHHVGIQSRTQSVCDASPTWIQFRESECQVFWIVIYGDELRLVREFQRGIDNTSFRLRGQMHLGLAGVILAGKTGELPIQFDATGEGSVDSLV